MSHTFTTSLFHVVFSTKNRATVITDPERWWSYLGGIARKLQIETMAIGGTADHIHLLFSLPATLPLSEAVQKLKANSSRTMRENPGWQGWQEGYGAFSVSVSSAPQVKEYVRNQAEHHRRRSSREEFIALLQKAGIEFNCCRHTVSLPSPRDSRFACIEPQHSRAGLTADALRAYTVRD